MYYIYMYLYVFYVFIYIYISLFALTGYKGLPFLLQFLLLPSLLHAAYSPLLSLSALYYFRFFLSPHTIRLSPLSPSLSLHASLAPLYRYYFSLSFLSSLNSLFPLSPYAVLLSRSLPFSPSLSHSLSLLFLYPSIYLSIYLCTYVYMCQIGCNIESERCSL